MPEKLKIPVSRENYSVKYANNVYSDALEGGYSRTRLAYMGDIVNVMVTLQTDRAGFDYLQAFYRRYMVYGSRPFLIDLIVDRADVREYLAKIVPDTFQLTEQSGNNYTCSMQLECKTETPIDTSNDATIVANYVAPTCP